METASRGEEGISTEGEGKVEVDERRDIERSGRNRLDGNNGKSQRREV